MTKPKLLKCKNPKCSNRVYGRIKYCSGRCHVITLSRPNALGCWIWQGRIDAFLPHYGRVTFKRDKNRKTLKAHRYSYASFKGPIPDNLVVAHKCNVGRCVNPDHLFLDGWHNNNDEKNGRMKLKREIRALDKLASLLSLPG